MISSEVVGVKSLPSGLNPAAFNASKFSCFPESSNRKRKAAISRNLQRYEKRLATQIGSSAFLQLNSNVPLRPIGLGAATWTGGVYAYAPDYTLNNGDPVTSTLTPRVGAGVLTPSNSSGSSANNPLFSVNAIGGRPAFDMSLNNSCFTLNWLAPNFQGNAAPCSIIFRGQRTQNESGCAFGFGTTSATLRFLELQHLSAGTTQVQRNDATTTSTAGPTTQNEGFTTIVVGMTYTGSTVSIYHNGVITSVNAASLASANISSLTQARWGTTGRGTAGTDDYAGYQSFLGVSPLALTTAQHLEMSDFLVAQDVPPSAGTPIMFAGDSITRAAGSGGFRKYLYEWMIDPAQDYSIDMQGPITSGSFPDAQCNAYSGLTIAQLAANLNLILGTGSAYPAIQCLFILIGTNDTISGYNGVAAAASYDSMLAALYTKLTSTVANARICCATLPPKDGANNAHVIDFNARLDGVGGVWDTFDAANPTASIIRVDYFNCFPGGWSSTYFLDAVHPNYLGYGLMANDPTYGLIARAGTYIGSISA